MMALATHQCQGSCSTFLPVPSSWSRGSKLKHSVPVFHAVGRKDRFISLKCRSHSSLGASIVLQSKSKLFKISAFKGSNQYDESGGGANGSKSLNNAVKVSYLQNKSEQSLVKSSEVQNVVPPPPYTADETTARSLAMHKLFKNWLMLLHMPSQSQAVEEALEQPSSAETSEKSKPLQKQERSELLKAVWCYFLHLDATIKIPLLLFTPLYLAVNLVYGSKVLKELIPLWILGPLFIAFYIKMFRAIYGLYAFSFKQMVKVIKNLPVYYLLVHDCVVDGKMKETMRTRILEPVADIQNMDYKQATSRKMKDLRVWLVDRYLDFLELIWPSYCRTTRFLKRANLI